MANSLVITGTRTCKKADEPDDSSAHYIYAFEVQEDYPEPEDPTNGVTPPEQNVMLMQYSEIASKLKNDKKSFVVKDEAGKKLELFEKNGSIILKRDNAEFLSLKGTLRMNERFDPNIMH